MTDRTTVHGSGGPLMPRTPLEPITVRIPEACRITGIGRSKLYELIQSGEIRAIKVGRMTLIPIQNLRDFLACEATSGR